VADDTYGPWVPLTLDAVVELLAPARFRWWVTGGHALELFMGRSWRAHDDTDIGICRRDASEFADLLAHWDVHIAAGGRLTPWGGEPLCAEQDQNNLWCRRAPDEPWCLDVVVGDGDADEWIYRRDPRIRAPWDDVVLRSDGGVPYLGPELQLLFKSRTPRPKDDVDAKEVIPALDKRRVARLDQLLPPSHPWRALLP